MRQTVEGVFSDAHLDVNKGVAGEKENTMYAIATTTARIEKLVLAIVMMAVLVVALVPAPARAQTTESNNEWQMSPIEEVRALVQPSIVYLETEYSARVFDTYNRMHVGDTYSITTACSGFFVNPDGWIITAGHCAQVDRDVRDALKDQAAQWAHQSGYYASDDLTLKQIRGFAAEDYELEDQSGDRGRVDRAVTVWFGISVDGLSSGRRLPARIQAVRPFEEGDVTLLKIEAEDMPALELGLEDRVTVGTETVSVGYAASVDLVTDLTFDPSFKEGTVSSQRTVGDGLIRVFETSSALTGGMSGGPTVNLNGAVIGLNSFTVRGESQPFNFVFPASIIAEVLQEHGVPNEVGEVNALYREGIAALAAGDKATAVTKLTEVLGRVPNHELADEYLSLAQDLPDPVETTTTATERRPDTLAITPPPPQPEEKSAAGLMIGAAGSLALGLGAWAARGRLRSRPQAGRSSDEIAAPQPPMDIDSAFVEQVQMLASIHEQGLMTEDEFDRAKERLLTMTTN
ncbi:MAG TPA: trypsin-like peptidase domain-containing protein [Acidimicrobiia bacterium]|nr:trypsin-like peptidase domain-containing protein [Acidimicrobiia bacterium]